MDERVRVHGFDPLKDDGNIKIEIPANFPNQQSAEPQATSSIWIFLSTVDWSEPWLIGLISFHVICLLIALFGARVKAFQIFIFLFLLGVTYTSEYINEIAAKNWHKFSKQQYFDDKGMFISLVFSVPALINCCIITVMWLWESASLLIKVKRAQISKKAKQKEQDETQEQTSHPKSE